MEKIYESQPGLWDRTLYNATFKFLSYKDKDRRKIGEKGQNLCNKKLTLSFN